MMDKKKFFVFEKSWIGTLSLTVGNKVHFYLGKTDHWGLGFDYNHYERAFTLDIIHWYVGFEVWHNE